LPVFLQFSSLLFPTPSLYLSTQPMAANYSFSSSSPSSSIPSPKSSMFYYGGSEDFYDEPHFLQACYLCRKPLGQNKDIFMYRLVNY